MFEQYRQFLAKNERNRICSRTNTAIGRGIADSKYATKKKLQVARVGVPKLLACFKSEKELLKFNWNKIESSFVIKPASGLGGEGIVLIRKKSKTRGYWLTTLGKKLHTEDLVFHCQNILAGKYSLHNSPDMVLLEERIKIHPKFFAYTRFGTPDIRVILFNKVPVMAMVRLPTEMSGGRANLEQGAMGLGIDLATGLTTFGVLGKSEPIEELYSFRKKRQVSVAGIRIPEWRGILETAVTCSKVLPGLGFLGVDVVVDKDKGPVVLEVNARPGLSIQICNKAGLKRRMEKVEDLEIKSIAHAIALSRYLFGEKLPEVTGVNQNRAIVKPLERIKIVGYKKLTKLIRAKVDTGAYRSSIDKKLAEELGLLRVDNVLFTKHYRSALGRNVDRKVIGVTFWLSGKKVRSSVNVADRSKLSAKFLVGRRDLKGFLIQTRREKK